jgi:hypothetical protein
MNLGLKTGLLGGVAALALTVASVPAYAQDDITTLKQQLDAMKERLAKLEADKADKRRVAAAAAVEAGDKPRSWKLPGTNTSMNIGGFVKFSALWNFTGSGYSNGLTGIEGSGAGGYAGVAGSQTDNRFNGGSWDITARRSRFWIQTWTPTDWGELRTYIEADFPGRAGASTNPVASGPGYALQSTAAEMLRLRHAYGTLGPVLAGKTTTLWGGLIGAPEALDDGAPLALGPLRIPQIRYTHNLGGGMTISFALEEAGNISDGATAYIGANLNGAGQAVSPISVASWGTGNTFLGPQRWPDAVAAFQWNFPNGALYISGMVGQLFVDNGGNNQIGNGATGPLSKHDNAFKWAAGIGARYDFGRVEIGGQGYYGQGMGNKYTGPTTGFTDGIILSNPATNGADLIAVTNYGAIGYAQVKLTDTIRATAAYSWGMQEAASEIPGYYGTPAVATLARSSITGNTNFFWTATGNLLWNPVPQVTFGVEYTYQFAAKYNSTDLQTHRLQFAAIYRF